MNRLLLVGGGDHGSVIADLAEVLGWGEIAFLDDAWPVRTINREWPIVGKTEDLARLGAEYEAVLVSIGNNQTRLAIHRAAVDLALATPTLIHPSAVLSTRAKLGRGSVALSNVVVNAFAVVGEAVILNTACTIDHDCKLEDGVHVSPGAHLAGNVTACKCSWIGIGAAIREGVTIGEETMIAAGSVVISDIEARTTAIGVPARSRR